MGHLGRSSPLLPFFFSEELCTLRLFLQENVPAAFAAGLPCFTFFLHQAHDITAQLRLLLSMTASHLRSSLLAFQPGKTQSHWVSAWAAHIGCACQPPQGHTSHLPGPESQLSFCSLETGLGHISEVSICNC